MINRQDFGATFPFNDSLGDLDYFRALEDRWSQAFEAKNLQALLTATTLYYFAIQTRAQIDGTEIRAKLKQIEALVYTMDKNQDGQLSPMERARSAEKWGYCWEKLQELYINLAEIKVDSGWTLKKGKKDLPASPAMIEFFEKYMPEAPKILKALNESSAFPAVVVK